MPRVRWTGWILAACLAISSAATALGDSLPKATVTTLDNLDAVPGGKAALVDFASAPFPYRGGIPSEEIPGDDTPFLDAKDGQRRGHTSSRAGIYWEDPTYSDRRSLLYIPPGFDPHLPAALVVFFHGNAATLARDVVERQQIPRQLAESGLNAVLVAPQFAVDAYDSSAGAFWQPGGFARYLHEAADRLAEMQGGGVTRNTFARMPVILIAYSGGYLPAAWSLEVGGAGRRLRGVILLDAVYDEQDKFAGWIADHQPSAFFFSAFSPSSADGNGGLQDLLMNQGIEFTNAPPKCLRSGDVVFLDSGSVEHNDFVTGAWTAEPVKWLLDRIPGFPREAGGNAKTCRK